MPDLRPFEARSADHLRLVIESGHIGIWELDLASGHAVRNLAHDEIFGYTELLDEWTYDQFLSHVVEEDRDRVDQLQKSAIENQQEWAFQCRIRTPAREMRWISAAGRPLQGPDGKVEKLIGHVIDISDTKQKEGQLSLLTEELNHRVRNMLAIIKSIIRLSAPKAKDLPSFARALEGRVAALARSHQLVVADASQDMTPSAILRTELSAFAELENQVSLQVTDERPVSGMIGQGLALVFHELITNSLKYGAFASKRGKVTVSVEPVEGETRIVWRESGGPPVPEDRQGGFGSKLIEGAIGSHGSTDLRFEPDGVVCEIRLRRPG